MAALRQLVALFFGGPSVAAVALADASPVLALLIANIPALILYVGLSPMRGDE